MSGPTVRDDFRGVFFLSGPAHIQKCSPTQSSSTPSVGSQNGPLKPHPTYLELKVHNLQVLRIVDLPSMSANSIMPFHNHVSKLVHWLSRFHQIWPRGVFFVDSLWLHYPSLEFDYPLPWGAPRSCCIIAKAEALFCLRPIPLTKFKKALLMKRGNPS